MLGGCLTVIIAFIMSFAIVEVLFCLFGEIVGWVVLIAIPIVIGWVVVKNIKTWKERNN